MHVTRWMTGSGLAMILLVSAACDRTQGIDEIAEGSDIVVQTNDGHELRGRLAEVSADTVVVAESQGDGEMRVSRSGIASVRTGAAVEDAPRSQSITVPAKTELQLRLGTTVASDANQIDDPVSATLASPIVVEGVTVVPGGSQMLGRVTQAVPSAKVKGRAELGLRFDELRVGAVTYDLQAQAHFKARGTKAKDAGTIGIGAAAGALLGGLTGGGRGAAIGAAVGAGGGTAVVMATEGDEIRLTSGELVHVTLADSLTVTVPVDAAAAGE